MVPGAPSVMTTGPLLRPVWPAGPWASLEPGLPTLLPTLGPVRDRSGWTTCSAMGASTLCRSVRTMASEPMTATIWRTRGWSVPVREGCG